MEKKKIYLVQPSSMHTNMMPLPYAIAVLHAYVCENADITEEYAFMDYIFEKKSVCQVVEEMESPYAVFFSCYIWNYEYNKKLAEKIRERFPQAKLVFGGHNVPMNCRKAFDELPMADYIIIGEGERPFEDILLYFLNKKDRSDLKNIAYINERGEPQIETDPSYVADRLASPYQLGLLDSIVENNKGKYFLSATLETNRGCPFHCGYCDWGMNKAKIRLAPEEQVIADIHWMATHNIWHCYGADSNFGMFPRDAAFAKELIKSKQLYGSPNTFFVSFGKNSDQKVVEISAQLHKAHMLQGATLSFQSLNAATLESVGRKNMDMDYFSKMTRQYHLRRIPTYSELILGLPNETRESFKSGMGRLIACGQHSSIDVYVCCLLPNSDLGQPETVEKYSIKTQRLPFRRFDINEDEEIQEYSDIIVSTSTMTETDWCECNLFSSVVCALHHDKLFHCAALFLHNECQMSYEDIYSYVIDKWRENTESVFGMLLLRISNQLEKIADGKAGWPFDWEEQKIKGLSFQNAINKIVLRHYEEYLLFIEKMLTELTHNSELSQQIARFQAFCVEVRVDNALEREERFGYNFTSYFSSLYLGEPGLLEKGDFFFSGKDILNSVFCGCK